MGEKKPSIALSVAAVAAALALFCAVAWWRGGSLLLALGGTSETDVHGLAAEVRTSEGTVDHLPLDRPCTRTYATDLGTNVVIIEGGSVRISEADCANQTCVQEGPISHVGEQLVCLPHRFTVEVVAATPGEADPDGFDTVSR